MSEQSCAAIPSGGSGMLGSISRGQEARQRCASWTRASGRCSPQEGAAAWATARSVSPRRCDSTEKLRALLPRLEQELKDPVKFKDFYQFTFSFAKNPGQKGLGECKVHRHEKSHPPETERGSDQPRVGPARRAPP